MQFFEFLPAGTGSSFIFRGRSYFQFPSWFVCLILDFSVHLGTFLVSYHFRLTVSGFQDSSCAYRLVFLRYRRDSWHVDIFQVLSNVLWHVANLSVEPHLLVVIFRKDFFNY